MSTLVAQTISNGTVSTSSANVIQGSAKAWVNYNGNTQTLRGSYNISSVTRTGAGAYTLNFTNSFADANYSAVFGSETQTTLNIGTPATSNLTIVCRNTAGTNIDVAFICAAIFR
jgi:hypothetical protein